MDYRKIIKEIGRGKNHARDLDFDTARGFTPGCWRVMYPIWN